MRLSIVTPVWNHWTDVTKLYLEQLLKSSSDYEVIIVNNGSHDETRSELKKITDDRLTVINLPENRGFGEASNIGYQKATGDVVVFMNNDVVFHNPEWDRELLAIFEEEKYVIAGPQIVTSNRLTVVHQFPVSYINGWCLAARKDALEELVSLDDTRERGEVFDRVFGIAYFEDVELCAFASLHGFTLLEMPELQIEHLGSKTASDQIPISEQTIASRRFYLTKMNIHHLRNHKSKRIVFYAAGVPYPFIDSDFEGKGVGGAEASLILLSRSLARLGFSVEVYTKTTTTGMFHGVWYRNLDEISLTEYCDYFVLFRSFSPVLHYVHANVKVFWSCDQFTDRAGTWDTMVFPFVQSVVAISPYHRDYLIEHYKVDPKMVATIDLGVVREDYAHPIEKVPYKAIYCSVPGRGLARLFRMLPKIKEKLPDFSLTVTSDYRLWGLDVPDNLYYQQSSSTLPYVTFLGKVPRKQLVQEQLSSEVMLYPCEYDECFCISALECIVAGAVPVTFDRAALKTTVGSDGVQLSSSSSDDEFVQAVVDLFVSPNRIADFRQSGAKRLNKNNWDSIAKAWKKHLSQLDKVYWRSMTTCKICNMKVLNAYILNKHMVSKHPNEQITEAAQAQAVVEVTDIPKNTILRFKSPISVTVNGHKFEGTEVSVPYEYVDAVVENARTAYGDVVI